MPDQPSAVKLAPSERITALPRSGIRDIMDLALDLPDVIRLEIGDPDFPTPEHIVLTAARAALDGHTHYSPSRGLASLRGLIAAKVAGRNGFACTADEVVVTSGACGAVHAALLALLDRGDEILIPDPGWTTYVPMALAAGVVPVPYPLDRARGFALDPEAIERRAGRRTRAVVLNSPSNPTGAVADREELAEALAVAGRLGLWTISDECYEELVFEGEHVSVAALGEPERVVSVFSFSKTYAMTGWRVGYATAPRPVAELLAKAQEPLVSSASTISQKAGEAALTGPQEIVAEMRAAYRARRDAALAILDEAGVGYVRPHGAFYLMVDVSASGETSTELARRVLLDHRVALVPGTAFGENGEGFVRVSLAASEDAIRTGLGRLAVGLS